MNVPLASDDGDALPAAWHWLYFLETPSTAGTGRDGHPARGALAPPIPLPRRMWASGALELSAPDDDWSRTVNIDPVLLFRFSALTYNAHRIHYDRDYATGIEAHPGLVVHGPLLVVLLLDLLRAHRLESHLRTLRFRAVRPTFDLGAFSLRGRCEGPLVSLWSADGDNCVGMSATATVCEEP